MCGIAGLLRFDGRAADARAAAAMAEALAHRGPDGRRVHADGPLALAHARLSVIDLEGGWQPLSNEDGSVWVVLNGEIYNHAALRARLASRHAFRTRSDTEVIVHLWEERGLELLDLLDGMFAIALWDARARTLLLARDRLGKKPLYVHRDASRLAFASEPRALFALGDVEARVDPLALEQTLALRYVHAPRSGFEHVEQLEPGALLCVRDGGARGAGVDVEFDARVETRRWWRAPRPTRRAIEPARARVELRERLDAAVAKRLEADVPLGLLLSGGLDSTAVLESMARQRGAGVRTFTVAFSREHESEAPHARATAQHFGAEHTELELTEQRLVDEVEALLAHVDVPFADPSYLPTALVCSLARTRVTVCLTGDGGDELFGGYTRYVQVLEHAAVPALAGARASAARRAIRWLPRHRFKAWKLARALRERLATPERRFVERLVAAEPPLRAALLGERARLALAEADGTTYVGERLEHALELELADGGAFGHADLGSRMLALDTEWTLPGLMLTKTDRASMACGLELRSPLLDAGLLEWAAALPIEQKIHAGRGKRILREALEERVPSELLERKKRGFGTPLGRWFRHELAPLADGYLTHCRLAEDGWLDAAAVRDVLAAHRARARNLGELLWALLALEIWYREFVLARRLR